MVCGTERAHHKTIELQKIELKNAAFATEMDTLYCSKLATKAD